MGSEAPSLFVVEVVFLYFSTNYSLHILIVRNLQTKIFENFNHHLLILYNKKIRKSFKNAPNIIWTNVFELIE